MVPPSRVPLGLLLLSLTGMVPSCHGDAASPPEEERKSYKVLMLLPMSSRSHRNLFIPIAEGLAERGHEVTMISNQPPASSHANVYEIYHNYKPVHASSFNIFTMLDGASINLQDTIDVMRAFTKHIFTLPEVVQLYDRRSEFDVVILSAYMNEMMIPFAFEKPLIILCAQGLDEKLSAIQGNVLNPAYVVPPKSQFKRSFDLLGRMKNTFSHFSSPYMNMMNSVRPSLQEEVSSMFPSLPPIEELKKNLSLSFLNTDHCLEGAVPLLPSQVPIGGIQCRPGKTLPQDLLQWIEGAGDPGVVYFSLGTVARSSFMPKEYLDIFLAAFAKLPHRVIWKFEEELEGVPGNVLLRKWLPQQDILAHGEVKVFITHGGILSIEEALYHATPLLALPITSDQPRNAELILDKGFGLALHWKELTVERVVNAVMEITTNSRYKEKTEEVSVCMRDQPEKPLDRALWWTEYVIRHKGAPALASPGAGLSWTEYLLLDVLLLLEMILFLMVWMMCKLKGKIADSLFSQNKAKTE